MALTTTPAPQLGAKAIDFSLRGTDGKTYHLLGIRLVRGHQGYILETLRPVLSIHDEHQLLVLGHRMARLYDTIGDYTTAIIRQDNGLISLTGYLANLVYHQALD